MSDEPVLAYTVHHKGRKYRAGMAAAQIGPAAAEIDAHAWKDGVAPTKSAVPEEGAVVGGTPSGSPPIPTPSGLPTGGPAPTPVEEPEEKPAPAKRTAGNRRGGGEQQD